MYSLVLDVSTVVLYIFVLLLYWLLFVPARFVNLMCSVLAEVFKCHFPHTVEGGQSISMLLTSSATMSAGESIRLLTLGAVLPISP